MFSLILYKISLFLLGFNLFLLTRYAVHMLSIKHTFRHVPGPDAPSRLWGEEWELYHGVPGVRYMDWHIAFGKIVSFNGAFGVSNAPSLQTSTNHFMQHRILSITDPRAVSFVLGEGAYKFPKHQGVRAWFRALLGEGILWVEGMQLRVQTFGDY